MRTNKFGRNISLRDEVIDIIVDGLPPSDEIESFINSKDVGKMVDNILETVEEHIDYNIDIRRMVG